MASARCLHNRRFSSLAPCVPRVVIGTHVSGVAEIYLGSFFQSHRLDLRVFLFKPLLHQRFVAFDRTRQRLLAGGAELRQKTTHRVGAQFYVELVLDEFGHHLAGPQRKLELQLQRVLVPIAPA